MKKKEEEGKKITYVKLSSVNDLARLAYGSDFSSKNLFCYQKGKKFRIVLLGEHIANDVLAYYAEVDSRCRGIHYSSNESGERLELNGDDPGMEKDFIDVFQVDLGHLHEGSIDNKMVRFVKAGGIENLVKLTIKAAVKDEFIRHLYLFNYKGKQVIGGFDFVEELNDDVSNFYYTVLANDSSGKFIAYDYKNGKIEFTDRIREYSYMYLKIINLAEAFPFFNVPD